MSCKRLGTCKDRLHRKTWLMAKVPVQGGFELFDPLWVAPFGWFVEYQVQKWQWDRQKWNLWEKRSKTSEIIS